MNPWTLIVPSGGLGSRMGADRPKQYLEIQEKPILFHTLLALDRYFDGPKFIIPMDLKWRDYVLAHLQGHAMEERCLMVAGGQERYNSVKNVLELVDTPLTGVHDAVRPFVSQETVDRIQAAIASNDGVVPVVPLRDSLRKTTLNGSEAVPRSEFMSVQTPQCFQTEILRAAYQQTFDPSLTDDASIVERNGGKVDYVAGNDENIKITTPLDFILAQHLIAQP
jgi:2-C-methyl-D-erythritol 4-phosphate cytidylyltransferase